MPATLAVAFALAASASAKEASVADNCRGDIAYLPDFLIANDTGAADNRRFRGEAVIAAAYDKALREAASAKTEDDCGAIIQSYLRAWREGHLAVVPADWSPARDAQEKTGNEAAKKPEPQITWLSDKTVLLTFPTFFASATEDIAKMMADNRKRLELTPNWIFDVRNNNGGDDNTYKPVADAVIGNPIFIAGVEFLSTPANIEVTAGLCDFWAPGDRNCIAFLEPLVAAMRAVPPACWRCSRPGTSSCSGGARRARSTIPTCGRTSCPRASAWCSMRRRGRSGCRTCRSMRSACCRMSSCRRRRTTRRARRRSTRCGRSSSSARRLRQPHSPGCAGSRRINPPD